MTVSRLEGGHRERNSALRGTDDHASGEIHADDVRAGCGLLDLREQAPHAGPHPQHTPRALQGKFRQQPPGESQQPGAHIL